MAQDLTQIYGPLYGGLLTKQGIDSEGALAQNKSLQGTVGLLSQMAQQQERTNQIRHAEAMAQAKVAREQEAISNLQSQPDEVVQGILGMPKAQALALLQFGGPGELSKVIAHNAQTPESMRLINMLPPEQRAAAIQEKTGIGPKFQTIDQGGNQQGITYSPVSGVTPVYQAPKTALPQGQQARPIWLNADGSVNEALYQRTEGLARAGANQAPSLTINSPLIPGKEAQNKIDAGILDTGQQMASMSAIERGFKPEYQTLGTRWNALNTATRERLGLGVKPEDQQLLSDYTQYRGRAASSLNSYIKSITGAALSEAEADRIMKAVPVAGNSVFDGDSPTEFKAKMASVMSELRMATARHTYMKRQGFALGEVPLDQMPHIMRKRADEIREQVKRTPGITDQQVKDQTKRKLAEEFGLVYEQ